MARESLRASVEGPVLHLTRQLGCEVESESTLFHTAARAKVKDAFVVMAKIVGLSQLDYKLDAEGNTVLNIAAFNGSIDLLNYITKETKVKVNTKSNKGLAAVDLFNKEDEYFLEPSKALTCDPNPKPKLELPSSPKETENIEIRALDDDMKKHQKEMLSFQSRDQGPEKQFNMQLEALQSARNTLIIFAVLIASVAFTSGINPPGGVNQEKPYIGKSTAARTLAFVVFSISNSVALFASVSMVILLLSVIPYREDSLLKFLGIAHWMMWVAVTAMASAYVSAASVTIHIEETKWLVYAILAIASFTLGGMFVYLRFKLAKCFLRKVRLLRCASPAPRKNNGSLDMAANIEKGYYSY